MAEHMKGPWDADVYEDGGFVILSADGDVIASRNTWTHKSAASKANARLISAAPDLLEVVRLFQDMNWNLEGNEHGMEIRRRALAAVQKAGV